jgi:hypothetical protein
MGEELLAHNDILSRKKGSNYAVTTVKLQSKKLLACNNILSHPQRRDLALLFLEQTTGGIQLSRQRESAPLLHFARRPAPSPSLERTTVKQTSIISKLINNSVIYPDGHNCTWVWSARISKNCITFIQF